MTQPTYPTEEERSRARMSEQVAFLDSINTMRLRKQEQVLARLNHAKQDLLDQINKLENNITQLTQDKATYKVEAYADLVGKRFGNSDILFIAKSIDAFDLKILKAKERLDKKQEELKDLEKKIIETQALIKKHQIKKEKLIYMAQL